MATRRALLAAGVGLATEATVGACNRTNKLPQPSETPPSPSISRSRIPPILDLTGLMANTPRPAAVNEAAKATARLWLDGPGGRNALTATHVGNGQFLSVEHGRRRTVDGTERDPIVLTRYRARLAMRGPLGELVVMRATKAAMVRDMVTDAALFQVDDLPSGLAVATPGGFSELSPGSVLHMAGYQPVPGTSRFDIPIDQPAPQAGIRMAALKLSSSQMDVIVGTGPHASEGDFKITLPEEGSSGGSLFNDKGQLVAVNVAKQLIEKDGVFRETVSVADIIEHGNFGVFERVVVGGNDVPPQTELHLRTCQTVDDGLIRQLQADLAPIPSPGY